MPESKEDELVLCISRKEVRERFDARAKGSTWLSCDEDMIEGWLSYATKAFLPRSIAETSPDWLHLATYCVLASANQIFSYRRGKSGSESRLHGSLSIGVGGHVGLVDYGLSFGAGIGSQMLKNAAFREIDEELSYGSCSDFGLVGLIADSSTPVNSVHLGVAYRMTVARERVRIREDCLADPQWLTVAELIERKPEMEAWSRILVEEVLASRRNGGQS